MKTAEPFTIPKSTLARIKQLAAKAPHSRDHERSLYYELVDLSPRQQQEVLALYNLGGTGDRSFEVEFENAGKANLAHMPGSLADRPDLLKRLNAGLKRYRQQS